MSVRKISLQRNVDLQRFTTIKIGGRARNFFTAQSAEDLGQIIADCETAPYILGKGSNLLIADRTIARPVIKLGEGLGGIRQAGDRVIVGASTPLPYLLHYCLKNNLSGLEYLAGIPATVGGLLAMNASSFDGAVSGPLDEVEVLDNGGAFKVLSKGKISFGYRHSSLEKHIILRATFSLCPSRDVRKKINYFLKKRLSLQDFLFPSCGCVFKNTDTASAGFLIDSCGLKGLARGGAQVSPRHANFIINRGHAAYFDVDYLIQVIRDKVYKKYGVILQEEIKRWTQ
jgi:UDP-N-acetylmuramate dehydrogenase